MNKYFSTLHNNKKTCCMTMALTAETDELCPGYRGVYGLLSGFIGQLMWVVHKALKPVIS